MSSIYNINNIIMVNLYNDFILLSTTESKDNIYLKIKYNHQCELVVFSAAESLYCRPRPERPPEVLNFCTTFTY